MSIATEAALMFEDSFDIFGGELIVILPNGTKHQAIISDNRHEKEINDSGNVVSVERMNVYFPKTDIDITLKNRIKARGKSWRITSLDDDEAAWNLSLSHVRR